MTPEQEARCAEARAIREKLGLTQQQMADRLGLTVRSISRYETGASPPPARVLRAMKALRVRKRPTKETQG